MAPIATVDLTEVNPLNSLGPKNPHAFAAPLLQVAPSERSVWQLSSSEVEEIETALRCFEDSSLALNQLCPETFPLPSLHMKINDVKELLCTGDGYILLKGLRPNDYTPHQNAVIFAGLVSHVGHKRAMTGYADGSKSVLQHITEVPVARGKALHHLANQTKTIPMHTDKGDIVALYTLSRSLAGGRFYLADIDKVYKEMLLTRPDLAATLVDDWVQMDPASENGSIDRPLVFPTASGVKANFSGTFITGVDGRPRPASLPPLTSQQHAALAELQRLSMKNAVAMDFRPGHLLLFNNLRLMHARDAFTDDQSAGRKRHLMRLIFQAPESWEMNVPVELEDTWKGLYNHEIDDELFDIKPELCTFSMGP